MCQKSGLTALSHLRWGGGIVMWQHMYIGLGKRVGNAVRRPEQIKFYYTVFLCVFYHWYLGRYDILKNILFLLQIVLLDGKRSLNVNIFLKQFRR